MEGKMMMKAATIRFYVTEVGAGLVDGEEDDDEDNKCKSWSEDK